MADEQTEERLEAERELIDLQLEQIRTGKKANEQAIRLWLETNKYGIALTAAGKATKTLTGGFKDSAKAMASSTGDFNNLSGAVGGTVKAVTGLMGAMTDIVGEIPFVGGALDAMGDAAIEVATFAFGEVQKGFDTFQDLSKAGQIGADGIEGMAKQFRAANLPLATYSKLLKENSTDLAFLSTSAMEGGKTFSKTMVAMASDTGMPLRRLGLSVQEIGDTVVDFQVMQRRQGLLGQLSQEQIRIGTEAYGKELDLIAKLTGKNREEIQKEREATMSDSRFRAAMMDRSQEEQKQHMDAIAQISDPTLKRAYMDQVSGFTNSTASITAEISGMGGSIREAIAHIDDLGGNSTDAINIMREQAREVTKAGGVLQEYSKVVESGGGVMMNFADLADFSVKTMQAQKDAADAQLDQMTTLGTQADKLAKGMTDMQAASSKMSHLFLGTDAASEAISKFAEITNEVIGHVEGVVLGKIDLGDAGADVAEQLVDYGVDVVDSAFAELPWNDGAKQLGSLAWDFSSWIAGNIPESQEASNRALANGTPIEGGKVPGTNVDWPVTAGAPLATGNTPKPAMSNKEALIKAKAKYNAKFDERADFVSNALGDDNTLDPGEKRIHQGLTDEINKLNATVERLLKATQEGIIATKDLKKPIEKIGH